MVILAGSILKVDPAQAGAKRLARGKNTKAPLGRQSLQNSFPKEQWPDLQSDVISGNNRFWGLQSPKEYSRALTQEAISAYPEVFQEICIQRLHENPKAYVDELRTSFEPIRRIHNRTTRELRQEMRRLKTGDDLRHLIPGFIDWLAATSEYLFNLKNFESIVAVLSVPSYESEYWALDGSFNRKSLGNQDVNFQFFFFNFMNLFKTEEMEELSLAYGVLFISGTANLSKQFEYLSSDDYQKARVPRTKLVNAVCQRIDRSVIREYAQKFLFESPLWAGK